MRNGHVFLLVFCVRIYKWEMLQFFSLENVIVFFCAFLRFCWKGWFVTVYNDKLWLSCVSLLKILYSTGHTVSLCCLLIDIEYRSIIAHFLITCLPAIVRENRFVNTVEFVHMLKHYIDWIKFLEKVCCCLWNCVLMQFICSFWKYIYVKFSLGKICKC